MVPRVIQNVSVRLGVSVHYPSDSGGAIRPVQFQILQYTRQMASSFSLEHRAGSKIGTPDNGHRPKPASDSSCMRAKSGESVLGAFCNLRIVVDVRLWATWRRASRPTSVMR
eukprot:1033104-Prymnesium_polylepis.1